MLTLAQARIPAVCLPGYQSYKEKHAGKLKEKHVFICLGNDELGRREGIRIETMLQEHAKEIYIVHLPEAVKDVNDLFVRAQTRSIRSVSGVEHTPVVVAAPLEAEQPSLGEAVEAAAAVIMLLRPKPSAVDAEENDAGQPVSLELVKNPNGPLAALI